MEATWPGIYGFIVEIFRLLEVRVGDSEEPLPWIQELKWKTNDDGLVRLQPVTEPVFWKHMSDRGMEEMQHYGEACSELETRPMAASGQVSWPWLGRFHGRTWAILKGH